MEVKPINAHILIISDIPPINKFNAYLFAFFIPFFFSVSQLSAQEELAGAGIYFTENKGQIIDVSGNSRPDILFQSDGKGVSFYIRKTGVSYVLGKSDEMPEEVEDNIESFQQAMHYSHRVDMDFVGSNADAQMVVQHETEGYKNFYYPHCIYGITNVKSYTSLTQKNIYDNIDVVYKGNHTRGLKYDIVVKPGGDYRDIKLKYIGQDELKIKNGELIIETSLGEMIEWMPKVYQNINGKIVDVKCGYALFAASGEGDRVEGSLSPFGRAGEGFLSFKLGTFNPNFPLVIDPWITYFGGSSSDAGVAIATDAGGNAVFTGYTGSSAFPVLGAYQTTLAGLTDVFITKVDPSGAAQWSTYYGGSSVDNAFGICADMRNGDVYVSGRTRSTDFPIVAGAGYMSAFPTGASFAAFLVKLNSSGALQWATYYGDVTGSTVSSSVAVDNNSNVIIHGQTSATANISTIGTFQTANAGGIYDAFVVKFSSAGIRLWASYCGGKDMESSGGISCDASDNIYIAGTTMSNNFPASAGSHQPTFGRGQDDAFLFKFSPTGNRLWATYYGGSGSESKAIGASVKVDLNNDVYLGGVTRSANNISTPGSFQPGFTPGTDGFLAKFNSVGTRQWATYIGGVAGASINAGDEYVTGIAIDVNNNVIIAGDTYSTDFPVTSCAYQTTFQGSEDQFLTTFDSGGNLICSGYIGQGNPSSMHNETFSGGGSGGCIATDGIYVYLIATTDGNYNYPITTNSSKGNDAVVAQLCVTSCGLTKITADFVANPLVLCSAGDSTNFILSNTSCDTANTTYRWSFDGGTPATSTAQHPANIVYENTGMFSVKVVIETPCGIDSVIKENYVDVGNHFPLASFTTTPQPGSVSSPVNFINQSIGSVQWQWNFGDVNGGNSSLENPYFIYSDSGIYIIRLIAINEFGCTDTTEQMIFIENNDFTFYVPNTFTPDGDGLNDVFIPVYNETGLNASEYSLLIYDRWGNLIFSSNDPSVGWDGRANNGTNIAQVDVYVWKVKLQDVFGVEHTFIGHVNLLK